MRWGASPSADRAMQRGLQATYIIESAIGSQLHVNARCKKSRLPPVQAQNSKRCAGQSRPALASGYDYALSLDSGIKIYEQTKKPTRRIVAEASVQAPVDQVWSVLTDYELLPTFVPNLDRCEKLASTNPGKILLRQVACSQGALWRLEAEALLEVEEISGPLGRREVRFTAINGDFYQLSGRWMIEPDASSSLGQSSVLRYDISVQPRIPVPPSLVAYVVRAGLPANIKAIIQRAEFLATKRLQASGLASWAGVEEDPPLPSTQQRWEESGIPNNASSTTSIPSIYSEDAGVLPAKGPFWPRGSPYAEVAPITAKLQRQRAFKEAARSTYLGTDSVPLPPAGPPEQSLQRVLDFKFREKQKIQALYPAFGLRRSAGAAQKSMATMIGNSIESCQNSGIAILDSNTINNNSSGGSSSSSSLTMNNNTVGAIFLESTNPPTTTTTTTASPESTLFPSTLPAEIHLRRLDDFDNLHRRAVAAITVDAPASLVWQVLTDYDSLAEFIPNLAASERIKLPPSAPPNIVRVRQVGYKRLMYMCLHAESVLDLIEKPCSEIQFRQVAGDFDRFQGKWMLSEGPADPELASNGYTGPQTQLKYAMELTVHKNGRMLGVIEPLLERVVFEDVPANLAAIKQRVERIQMERKAEALEEAGEVEKAANLRRKSARPRLPEMVDDFTVLAVELERCFGDVRKLPTRDALREMNRTDLEKAIAAHGGPSSVADRLGWKLQGKARKPRGYWDSLLNVKQELDDFIQDNELQPGIVPVKNDFIRAGRYDLARAVERWGGLYELAAQLGYRVAEPVFSSTEWNEHISEVAAKTGLSGKQGLFEVAARTYKRSGGSSSSNSDEGDTIDGGEQQYRNNGSQRTNTTSTARRTKESKGRYATLREEIDAW